MKVDIKGLNLFFFLVALTHTFHKEQLNNNHSLTHSCVGIKQLSLTHSSKQK
jgi:hypothetical protein